LPPPVWPEEKIMKTLLRPAVSLFVLLTAVTGVVYPLAVTGIAKAAFPEAAEGSLIVKDGKAVGSRLIGQNFTDPKYFWGRPSATGPMPYNASASGGSNQGPLNPALSDAVKGRIEALKAVDRNNTLPIPADLVNASASGLDPHISPEGRGLSGGSRCQPAPSAAGRPQGFGQPAHRRPPMGCLRRTPGECPATQHRA
jgi:K+-transporting ATPase ATPase C chain